MVISGHVTRHVVDFSNYTDFSVVLVCSSANSTYVARIEELEADVIILEEAISQQEMIDAAASSVQIEMAQKKGLNSHQEIRVY